MDKYPLTIRLDDELMKVVRVQATLTRSSLGSVVVDAARQALMPEYQQKQEQILLKAMDRCFNRLVKMHEDQQAQHELVGRCWRCSCDILSPDAGGQAGTRGCAWASAANRFEVFLDALATNRRNRMSVMDPPPPAGITWTRQKRNRKWRHISHRACHEHPADRSRRPVWRIGSTDQSSRDPDPIRSWCLCAIEAR